MSIRGDIRKVARKLTILYKEEILRKDLIDTGNLKKSFDVRIRIDASLSLNIEVSSLYYFKYLNAPYTVNEDVLNSLEYKLLEMELIDIITRKLFTRAPKNFKTNKNVEYKYKFLNI